MTFEIDSDIWEVTKKQLEEIKNQNHWAKPKEMMKMNWKKLVDLRLTGAEKDLLRIREEINSDTSDEKDLEFKRGFSNGVKTLCEELLRKF